MAEDLPSSLNIVPQNRARIQEISPNALLRNEKNPLNNPKVPLNNEKDQLLLLCLPVLFIGQPDLCAL